MDLNLLYFPKSKPPVEPPKEKDYFTDVEYSGGSPMWEISVSNIALQYILDTRDGILSRDNDEMGGYAKMGVVTLLCLTATIGYTVLNIAETSLRALAGVVGFVVTFPLMFIVDLFSIDAIQDSWLEYILITGCTVSIMNLAGAIKGTCQIGTGFLASYEMATSTKKHCLPVHRLTDIADFGLSERIEKCIGSMLK